MNTTRVLEREPHCRRQPSPYTEPLTDRYTPDELARFTDADLVRREIDSANRKWLVVLLLAFAGFGIAVLVRSAFGGPIPAPLWRTVAANMILNVIAVTALRLTVRNVTTWVLIFCVVQYLAAIHQGGGWVLAGAIALFFARFRLTAAQSLSIHAFMVAALFVFARLHPVSSNSGNLSDAVVNRAVLGVNLVLMGCAFGLQTAGTRRVRREIMDTWRDPLQNAREQVRMRDELHYARQLQLSMLPEAPPRVDWLDIAAVSIPAAEVGGDYYDFFVEGDRVAIVACDVAGHGMQSGLVLAAIRGGLITTLRRSMTTPAAVLLQLHDLVAQTSRRRMLTTAVVVLLDRAAGRVTIASAAHPPVIVRRTTSTEVIDAFAPPLGVRLPFQPAEHTMDVGPGDVVVIHSDGVYESRNALGEEYGLDRLQRFVDGLPSAATAAAIRDGIVRDIERFRGRPQDDDATLVVARLR